jgi:penicillin amidase
VTGNDWNGSLPVEFYPFSINPTRGFLSSANQQPVDPEVNPRYLGADWPAPWRAMRINQLLRADSAVTVEAMRRYQTDHTSARAAAFLPFLLGDEAGQGAAAAMPEAARTSRAFLREWDRSYARGNRRAVLFEAVMEDLDRLTWDELAPTDSAAGPRLRPSETILLGLLHEPESPWWDDRRTPDATERRDDIIAAALASGLERTRREHGDPDTEGWRWGEAHRANIHHLLQIPALSALDLSVDAGPGTLNPSSGSGVWGPSWRMVVELGPEVRAWATYPGGQSGNPASPNYRDLLPAWLEGRLDSLVNPRSPTDFPEAAVATRIAIRPRR